MHNQALNRVFAEELDGIFDIQTDLCPLFCRRNHQIEFGCPIIERIGRHVQTFQSDLLYPDIIHSEHRVKQRITAYIPRDLQLLQQILVLDLLILKRLQ
ncbi:hypothetical protein D3C77_451570 [compost metagenome]